jgi:hypothetical protein
MPDISLETRVHASEDVVVRELEGESVLLNLATGVYFGLDTVGTRIWQLIEQHGRLADVRDAITREFEVDADAAGHDLRELVDEMAARGLVEIDR